MILKRIIKIILMIWSYRQTKITTQKKQTNRIVLSILGTLCSSLISSMIKRTIIGHSTAPTKQSISTMRKNNRLKILKSRITKCRSKIMLICRKSWMIMGFKDQFKIFRQCKAKWDQNITTNKTKATTKIDKVSTPAFLAHQINKIFMPETKDNKEIHYNSSNKIKIKGNLCIILWQKKINWIIVDLIQ